MEYPASQDVGEVFNALWPHLVETIGAAVDGDPTKIRVLQEAPYSLMQMQSVRSAGNHGPATNSDDASSSVLPSLKTKRNRNPCHACKLRRQRVIGCQQSSDSINESSCSAFGTRLILSHVSGAVRKNCPVDCTAGTSRISPSRRPHLLSLSLGVRRL